MALGWIAPTSALASVVRKPKELVLAFYGFALVARVPCHAVQIPAKKASGRLSSIANHVGVFLGLVAQSTDTIGKRGEIKSTLWCSLLFLNNFLIAKPAANTQLTIIIKGSGSLVVPGARTAVRSPGVSLQAPGLPLSSVVTHKPITA
jgi:hypothetical protein